MIKILPIIVVVIFTLFVPPFFYGKFVHWYCNKGMRYREKTIARVADQGKTRAQELIKLENSNVDQYLQCLNSFGIKVWREK